jgi:hypothetical protein
MGLHWEWEVPDVLEQNQLLAKEEVKNIYDALESETDPEAFLRPVVQKAYFRYYGRSKQLTNGAPICWSGGRHNHAGSFSYLP